MVKINTSILAVTLATSSVLASSNEFQRREVGVSSPRPFRFGLACAHHDNLQSRGFVDKEDVFERDLDAFDDLEARAPLPPINMKAISTAFRFGKDLFHHKNTQRALTAADYGSQAYMYGSQIKGALSSRDVEDNEDVFFRDLDDDLETRAPLPPINMKALGTAFRFGKDLFHHKNTQRALKAADYGSQAYMYGSQIKGALSSRAVEDKEDVFDRDLDAFDDLEARQPSTYCTYQTCGNGPGGLYRRDLDVEELFGREYGLLDERDTIDDLD
jgi:hypothetical protein